MKKIRRRFTPMNADKKKRQNLSYQRLSAKISGKLFLFCFSS